MSIAELSVVGENHKEKEIHLFVERTNGAEATIPLRWCACKPIFDELKEKEVTNPCLVLLVAKQTKAANLYSAAKFCEVERKVLPLSQAMEWIQFQSPGDYRIYVMVVHGSNPPRIEWIREAFLKKDCFGNFDKRFVDETGKVDRGWISEYYGVKFIGEGQLAINVAQEFFAKEPLEWLSHWVNFWYETKPKDQCQFRRRCILAFTVQPLVVFLFAVMCGIAKAICILVIALVIAQRGLKPLKVFRPLKYSLADLGLDDKEPVDPFFLEDSDGELRSPVWWVFTPAIPLAIFLFSLFYSANVPIFLATIPALIFTAGFVASWVIAWTALAGFKKIGALVGMAYAKAVAPKMFEAVSARRETARKVREENYRRLKMEKNLKEQQKFKAELDAFYETEFQAVVCTGVPLKPELKELPKKNRTLHLKFWDLKAKVCKPFAR